MNANFDSDRRSRRSIRLTGYDYSRAGAYFVTVCTHDRTLLFGEIANGEMRLNDSGRLVHEIWDGLPEHYLHVDLDAFVIMPNHIHGIIFLTPGSGVMGTGMNGDDVSNSGSGGSRAGLKPAPTRHGLPEVVRAFKTFSARRINEYRQTLGTAVWQRNYYEHIIRNECDLNRIRQYIIDNPAKWPEDPENPGRNPDPVHNAR